MTIWIPFVLFCLIGAVLWIPMGAVTRKVIGVVFLVLLIVWLLMSTGTVNIRA